MNNNHHHQYMVDPRQQPAMSSTQFQPLQSSAMHHYQQHYHPSTSSGYNSGLPSYYPSYTTSGYGSGYSAPSSLLPMPASSGGHQYHSHPGSYAATYPDTSSHQYQRTGAVTGGGNAGFDTTGQIPPPNITSKITATLWEDEGTLCYCIEARGITVSRRDDNNMVNGTKLLNVAGMTRGRRDGMLKSEKARVVVKIGPMHLKGVWIPLERALEYANKERITDVLFPLFLQNVGATLAPDSNPTRSTAEELRSRAKQQQASNSSSTHHNHPSSGRSNLDHSHTMSASFPTPPTSTSSIIGGSTSSYGEWSSHGTQGSGIPLAIDTSLSNTRSGPNTPASTPPGQHPYSSHTTMSQYPAQSISRYGSNNIYIKNEMGPPTKGTTSSVEEQGGIKGESYPIKREGYPGKQDLFSSETDPSHDDSYSRASYMGYNGITNSTITSPEQSHSSPHQTSSGRGTPRNSIHSQQQWTGINTPPRSSTTYNETPASVTSTGNSYCATNYLPNLSSGIKRSRDDDDGDYKLPRSNTIGELDSIKRRRTDTGVSLPSSVSSYDQGRSAHVGSVVPPRLH